MMAHLTSIEIRNFKGVSSLTCTLDSMTVLAGTNNSGKTSILQATYLLFAAIPIVARHPHHDQTQREHRVVSLSTELSPLGFKDTDWLWPLESPDAEGTIIGYFSNSLVLELGILRRRSHFVYTLRKQEGTGDSPVDRTPSELIHEIENLKAVIMTPPGDVPAREQMVNGDQFESLQREGKGAQLWRNSIWWAIQSEGFESFEPVQKRIKEYFPAIELLLPTLSTVSPPEIQINYKELNKGPLDIAQSGAGLRTFVSLTRILDQSAAQVILLDEPDAHLHSSQQAVVVDLLLDVTAATQRQVILATHSPEIISRVPTECLRWIDRSLSEARGGDEAATILERLGASPDVYLPREQFPDVLVYVEGVKDRPVIESVLKWCQRRVEQLPRIAIIPHRDGRFDAKTLEGMAAFARLTNAGTRILGIRDLDWYYPDYPNLPSDDPIIQSGKGWSLITIPCKEMENLLCQARVLFEALDKSISEDLLQVIIDEESNAIDLVEEWRHQVCPRIRDRLSTNLDPSTREKEVEQTFIKWSSDSKTRSRLVAGKSLIRRIRRRVAQHGKTFYSSRVFENLTSLPPALFVVARQMVPDLPSE